MDFLSEENMAGQTLLKLVSRGNAINAEMLRLSDHIPSAFLVEEGPSKGASAVAEGDRRFVDLMWDFKYMTQSELFEEKLNASETLLELDEELRETHLPILERFYLMFESIYKYIKDFLRYLEELNEGVFIQHTFESILMDFDGKQLLAEAVHLYGVMLLLMDERIEGIVRERMLVAFYRYKGSETIALADEVCKLCRTTGYQPSALKKPLHYPEDYFARFPLPKPVIHMIIGRLRSDDVYKQILSFPNPEHRSTALATQGSMLYVILYFAPEILHKEQAIMREIVDKHFPDNWVISYFMGFTVDLSEKWEGYKAAKAAINNTVNMTNVKELHATFERKVTHQMGELQKYLTEGVLLEDYVLDHIPQLLNCVRECNVTIRWLLLHRTTRNKKLRDIICASPDHDAILLLIMHTAQFEYILKKMLETLLEGKRARWEKCKQAAAERMTELGEFFTGHKVLSRMVKDENLQQWFVDLASQVQSLDYQDSTLAGRKIQQLILALEEVEQFHQIETNLQIKAFLLETRNFLKEMIRTVNVKEEILITLSFISDMGYSWEIIDDYVSLMHRRLERDPFCVLLLRATFLKLVSILELVLVRISQAKSEDLISVSEYFSGELVAYVRKVLEIIPISMFRLLFHVSDLLTNTITELDTKIERDKLKDNAQLDKRQNLARTTHQISVFTEGILAMETTLVGVIEVEPAQLLEDGVRKELVRQISQAMNEVLVFRRGTVQDFEQRLETLASRLDGFNRAFEYIQDYVRVYGLKIWQEEFSRIINFNVEQECNTFLKKKVLDWQSQYQSSAIPIPRFPPPDSQSNNFMGSVARELLSLVDCRKTVYIDARAGWFDFKGEEVVGIRTISLLRKAFGIFGLHGVDKLLCFMIVHHLQRLVQFWRKAFDRGAHDFIRGFVDELSPTSSLPESPSRLYQMAMGKTSRLWPFFLEIITQVGQCQLIRKQIANELNFACKLDSNVLSCALEVMNKALITDVQAHYSNPDVNPYPSEENDLLFELSSYLELAGISGPLSKIYVTSEPFEFFPAVVFLFTISQLAKFTYDKTIGVLVCKNQKEPLDGMPFCVGVFTLLKQVHSSHTGQFLAYLGQYVRAMMNTTFSKDPKPTDLPSDVTNVLVFLEEFCTVHHLSRKVVEAHVPSYLFDCFRM